MVSYRQMSRPQRSLTPGAPMAPAKLGAIPGQPPGPATRPPQGTLIVGQGIEVTGGIGSCDTLIIEGTVEASLDVKTLEVREGGLCKGKAETATAEIAGVVEGGLTVRGKLKVLSTGRVTGTIRYGEIAIEPGGRISGDVDVLAGVVLESGAA